MVRKQRMLNFKKARSFAAFTFVEVMVLILLASTVMVPIIGSMTNNEQHSVSIELRAAMENVAESKINGIIHDALYEGVYPNNSTNVINYPDDVNTDYHFSVVVEVKSPLTVTSMNSANTSPTCEGLQSGRFEAIAVNVSLQETYPQVTPVNLCTTVAIPRGTLDNIFTCAPDDKTIYEIDPVSHLTIHEFHLSSRNPYFLAVHPSGNWLLLKCIHRISVMDIRHNSSTYGQCVDVYSGASNSCVSIEGAQGDDSGSRLNRGLVFSQDGKSLYTSYYDSSGYVHPFRLNVPDLYSIPLDTLPSGSWTTHDYGACGTDKHCMDIKLGEDGYVYYAIGQNTGIKRINTHTNVIENFTPTLNVEGQTTISANAKLCRAISESWGGNEFSALFNGDSNSKIYFGFALPYAPTETWFDEKDIPDAISNEFSTNALITSKDNVWLFAASDANAAANKEKLFAYRRSPECDWINNWPTISDSHHISFTGTYDMIDLKHSPNQKEIMAKTIGDKIVFINVADFIADSGTSPAIWSEPSSNEITDITGRLMENAWISCQGSAGDNSIECFDIYGGSANGRFLKDYSIDTSAIGLPTNVTLTAGGDIADSVVNGNLKVMNAIDDKLDDYTPKHAVSALTLPPNFKAIKTVRLLDRSLAMIGNTSDTTLDSIAYGDTKPIPISCSNFNGFLLYKSNADGKLTGGNPDLNFYASYNGGNGFVVRDIVAMHRRNGAYVLMSETSSDDSILLWIEKSKVGGYGDPSTFNTDQWRIMYYWRSKYDGFPEGRPRKMALSPDDTMLALYDPQGDGSHQCVRIYDMNNQHFPMRPGFGLVRYNDNDTPANSTTNGFGQEFTDSEPKFYDNTLYQDFFTDYSTLPVVTKNFPGCGNYTTDSSTDGTYRYFGIWYPSLTSSTIKSLTLFTGDGYRPIINGAEQSPISNNIAHWNDLSIYSKIGYDLSSWSPVPSQVKLQLEASDNNEKTEYSVACRSDTAAAADSESDGGDNIVKPYARQLDSSGNDLHYIHRNHTRALRFRPMEIGDDLLFDGSDPQLPTLSTSSNNEAIIRFNRDMGKPTLFILDTKDNTLNVKELFGIANFTTNNIDLTTITDILSSTKFNDMQVSPDGRRLLLCCDTPNRLLSYDLTDTSLATKSEYNIPQDKKPLNIAIRNFNSYSSTPPNQKPVNISCSGTTPNKSCGNQRATMGPNGIYFGGGADTFGGTPQKTFYKFNPMTSKIVSLHDMPFSTRHGGLFCYDNKMFYLQGHGGSAVAAYSPDSWDTHYAGRKDSDNSDVSGDCFGSTLSPLGPLYTHGGSGDQDLYLYLPECYIDLTGDRGESITLDSILTSDGHLHHKAYETCMTTHYSRRYKSWHSILCMGTEGSWDDAPTDHGIQYYDYFQNTDSTNPLLSGENQRCYNDAKGNWQSAMTMRKGVGACTWGDEVFVFGGFTGGDNTDVDEISAFNPDRADARNAGKMPETIAYTSAVPCGPFIFLFQGEHGINGGSGNAVTNIWRYKP